MYKNSEKMNATSMNSNSPKSATWLAILLLICILILYKRCAAQSVQVDKDVLNYLFNQNAKTFYLERDVKMCDSIVYYQQSIVKSKDSLILNRNEAFRISQYENDLCNIDLNLHIKECKKANRKVKFFKLTTVAAIVIGAISCTYLLFH